MHFQITIALKVNPGFSGVSMSGLGKASTTQDKLGHLGYLLTQIIPHL